MKKSSSVVKLQQLQLILESGGKQTHRLFSVWETKITQKEETETMYTLLLLKNCLNS